MDDRITQAEMVGMFGSNMPVEAAQLVFDARPDMTVGEIRAKLREIAKKRNDDVTLTLPRHAVRFLARMCRLHRKGLSAAMMDGMPTVQSEAAFDSLNCIESVIPNDVWKETE